MQKHIRTVSDIFIHYYEGIVLFGIVMISAAIWIYEYHFTETGDSMIGLISSCLLFFGTLVLGQGIRGWRDGEEFRNRYIELRSKGGADVVIEKRKKPWFR